MLRILIIFIFLFSIEIHAKESKAFEIQIITYKNGVGLNKDIEILSKELTKLGHHVHYVDWRDTILRKKADINIFIEVVNEALFSSADKNYLIPNPEWFLFPFQLIPKFDKILCKTQESARVFSFLNTDTVFMGFTSQDRLESNVLKDYKAPLHLVGASIQKGTRSAIQTWTQNPQFPPLLIIKHKGDCNYANESNIYLIYEYLPDTELSYFQNNCGLHICPSETEGFGHYIMEALSCGAVVVTTNAPPMNEFVLDKRCLIDYSHVGSQCLATTYFADPLKMEEVIKGLLKLPEEELVEIGRKNREFYLQKDQFFKDRLAEIFGNAN